MQTSRISRTNRWGEVNSVAGKLVSIAQPQPQSHTKQIGLRSPRCLGPSSPFAYLKDPDYMNILPLDANAGKFTTIPIKSSALSKQRRSLDATLEEIGKDLEHITFLFQEITPQAPISIDKKEENIAKQERLQVLESVLEWLKAANFDLIWAKTTIEEKDLESSNDTVQSVLHDSIKSINRLRTIHKQLMLKFSDYFRQSQNQDAVLEEKKDVLLPSKSDPGLNYRALSAEVAELLQRERARTSEAYELKLNTLHSTLEGQALLIKKLTDNLKNKNLYELPKEKDRDSKTSDEDSETQKSKKTAKHKKKPQRLADEDVAKTSSVHSTKRSADEDAKDKELLNLQKILRSCQLDSARLSQQNRVLVETKKELATSNTHKDKVISELKAKLLHSGADKPTLDKQLVIEAPKVSRETPPPEKQEKPGSAHSRFIYVDSVEKVGIVSPPPSVEPPARPMMEHFAQKKGPFKRVSDEDDTQESEGGPAAGKGRKSGIVRDSEVEGGIVRDSEVVGEDEKEKEERQSFSSDSEKVSKKGKKLKGAALKDAEQTLDADEVEKQAEARDLDKAAAERSGVVSAGGRLASDVDAEKSEKQTRAQDLDGAATERAAVALAEGRLVSSVDAEKPEKLTDLDIAATERSAVASAVGRVVPGHIAEKQTGAARDLEKGAAERSAVASAGGRVVSGQVADKVEKQTGARDLEKAAVERSAVVASAEGRLVSGSDSQGAVEGKGRDGRGKGDRTSEGASVGGVDGVAVARERVGGSGLGQEKQLKAADDRTAGKAKEIPISRKSSSVSQVPVEGTDGSRRKSSKRLFGAGSRKSSDETLPMVSQRSEQTLPMVSHRSEQTLPMVSQRSEQSGDVVIKLDRDATKSDRVGGEVSFTDAKAQGKLLHRMTDREPTETVEGLRGKPMAGVEKESEKQQKGSALSRERSLGGITGGPVSEKDWAEKGELSDLAVGTSKYFKDRSQLHERDQRVNIRHGTPDPDFGGGVGYFGGQTSPLFSAVGWKGMPDLGTNVSYLPSDRSGSTDQQVPGFKYNLNAFMPQPMGQRLGWLADEREGVVPFIEDPLKGLRVTGATAVHPEKLGAEKELIDAIPLIQPLKDSAGMAKVLRSYDVNLNDPNTFAQQLEFIKQSGTVDGLKEAMKLLTPYLKLLGEKEQEGENALVDVMRTLQRRHAELITQELQPAAGVDTTEARQRRLLTFVTDRRRDICRSRAHQQMLLAQRQARGLVHLKPLLGQDSNALSSCPPYQPVSYTESLPQKLIRDSFPSHKTPRMQQASTSARETKLRQGNEYMMVGLTIDNLLTTIDKLAKCGHASSG